MKYTALITLGCSAHLVNGLRGDGHCESGLGSRSRSCLDGSAMCFDGTFDDRESQSGSFDLILRMMLQKKKKAFKDKRKVGAGDSDSVVRDGENDRAALLFFLGFNFDFYAC